MEDLVLWIIIVFWIIIFMPIIIPIVIIMVIIRICKTVKHRNNKIQEVLSLLNNNDFETAIRINGGINRRIYKDLEEKSKKGNKNALAYLGQYYEEKGNYKKAIFYYKKASKKGLLEAAYRVGLLYKKQNKKKESERWFNKSSSMYLIVKQYIKDGKIDFDAILR